jgi:hypothetical protein
MKTISLIIIATVSIIAIGVIGLGVVLLYKIGKEMTYIRPCGGGRHRG